ncbi:beta/alpha barrel domain-containing protein [Micromonospora narathiwatensis]|uniref:hypothetical protein n=1 Tax=Micromonospora narathiwatensis TaxID=299146 RepID=UPI0012FD8631|nr:hypothetical protein [Micromonospora narathiwatensis]
MTDWIVRIVFASTPPVIKASKTRRSPAVLEWKVVDQRTDAMLVATQVIRRRTAGSALSSAAQTLEWIRSAADEAVDPVSISVRPEGAPEEVPELVTIAEIAAHLGVSRQRAQQLSKQSWFPRPVARTRSGPIYTLAEVQQVQRMRETVKGRNYAFFAPGRTDDSA